ncbi:hypothetical protein T11_3454 [Trichinella zimbabwensis]|uniref:Uncharacterized protein n=1 Tax=Trichinella zimbabwensis TaxID=268475 RepID=A0A0V1GCY1_9BILA|nr:hypothetical protein T11_3454 [Trichinella zimbabwensis]
MSGTIDLSKKIFILVSIDRALLYESNEAGSIFPAFQYLEKSFDEYAPYTN